MYMTDVMKLSNVALSPTMQGKAPDVKEYRARSVLTEVVWHLAVGNPHWNFVVRDGRFNEDAASLRVDKIEVLQDEEKLGVLSCEYYRGQDRVAITCRRLKDILERGDTKHTANAKVAISTVKKLFAKQTVAESLEEAWLKTNQTFSTATYRSKQEADLSLSRILIDVKRFVFDEQLQQFRDYLNSGSDSASACALLDKFLSDKDNYRVVSDVYEKFKNGNSCLVVLNNGIYTVQFKDKTPESFDDDTLPYEYRVKLGLLKLVEEGSMVHDNGCRVSKNVFMLVF